MTAPSTPEAQTRSPERHGAQVKDGLFLCRHTKTAASRHKTPVSGGVEGDFTLYNTKKVV